MTNTETIVRESSLYSCVEIIQRTTRRSRGLGALIPPSETVTERTIATIPYPSTLAPANTCVAKDINHAYRIANTLHAALLLNPEIIN